MTKKSKLFITITGMVVMLTGCGVKEKQADRAGAAPTIRATEATTTMIDPKDEDKTEEDEVTAPGIDSETASEIDWNSILKNLESADLSDVGFYIDIEDAKNTAEKMDFVLFTNYEKDFSSVDKQILINYGIALKPDSEDEEYYDDPVYSINIMNNSDPDDCYYGIYSDDGECLFEEGNWSLTEDKDTETAEWLESLGEAMVK